MKILKEMGGGANGPQEKINFIGYNFAFKATKCKPRDPS